MNFIPYLSSYHGANYMICLKVEICTSIITQSIEYSAQGFKIEIGHELRVDEQYESRTAQNTLKKYWTGGMQ